MTTGITHQFRLHQVPFDLIAKGQKTIEARLNDEKRQQIKIGDEIVFVSRVNEDLLRAEVTNLFYSPTFRELFETHNVRLFGGDDVDSAVDAMGNYYTVADQERYGVVGIEIKLIS